MTADWMDEVDVLLRWLEQFVDQASRDPQLFRYAHDLLRLIEWLRTQPARRAALWSMLGTGVVIAVVVASRYRPSRQSWPNERPSDDADPDSEWADEIEDSSRSPMAR
jgi:hypothetical protein